MERAGDMPTSSSRNAKHALGTYEAPGHFHLTIEIDDADYRSIEDALGAVGRLQTPLGYKLVERNFLDLESIHQFVTITMSLGREFATPDHRTFGEAVMTAAINWLTAVRLFLDHTETDLKRRFGSDSPQAQRFKTSASKAYDAWFGYRFTYRFRNYVQHCGLPLSLISITEPHGQVHQHAKQAVELLLDRDALLDAFDGWSSIRTELAAMPEQFPLLPLAEEAMEGLRQVHRELLLIEVDEAVTSIGTLLDALERIRQAGSPGIAGVFSTEGDPANPTHMSPQLFPAAELIEELGRVRDGARTPDSLIGKTAPPTPPKFSPANIKARFSASRRPPRTTRDRCRSRPVNGSRPRYTRTSHTPLWRCRIVAIRASLLSKLGTH